jgi:hypothetical protein
MLISFLASEVSLEVNFSITAGPTSNIVYDFDAKQIQSMVGQQCVLTYNFGSNFEVARLSKSVYLVSYE